MGKKKNQPLLGKSIIKERFKSSNQRRNTNESWLHTSDLNDGYDWGRLNLNSVTEQSHLDDFLLTAELAGTEFTAERRNIRVVDPNESGMPSAAETKAIREAQELNKDLLCIPRRPKWDKTTSKETLVRQERDSFLEWRRRLAVLQEKDNVVMTPFECNLEFWRQLWRVIERSDIVVQIVDARNPLLFRCEDLERYVKEIGGQKQNMILISKADLLSRDQRQGWANYFTSQGIKVAFWSALQETERLKREAAEEKEEQDEDDEEGEEATSGSDEDESEEDDNIASSRSPWLLQDEMPESEEARTEETLGDDNSKDFDAEAGGRETRIPQPDGQADPPSTDPRATAAHRGLSPTTAAEGAPPAGPSPDEEGTPDNRELEARREGASAGETQPRGPRSSGESSPSRTVRFSDLSLTGSSAGEDRGDSPPRGSGASVAPGPDGGERRRDGGEAGRLRLLENAIELMTGEELIQLFYDLQTGAGVQEGVTTVGMVGYPNVGKSSTINALLQQKKVPVSATPGRTKHFQTLYVEPTMCLCDCPGLVMPSMVSSKAEMVVSGILCIDHLRECIPPVSLLCQRIPRHVLNSIYGINIIKPRDGEDLNRPPTAREFLNAYSYMRGFMTHHGVPDCPRAARVVLKDYVKGKLLFCHPPPGVDAVEFQAFAEQPDPAGADGNPAAAKREISGPVVTEEGTRLKKQPTASKLDEAFFSQRSVSSHTKGAVGPRGGTSRGDTAEEQQQQQQQQRLQDKPWKKHGNRNKREKLRRVYGHHDE